MKKNLSIFIASIFIFSQNIYAVRFPQDSKNFFTYAEIMEMPDDVREEYIKQVAEVFATSSAENILFTDYIKQTTNSLLAVLQGISSQSQVNAAEYKDWMYPVMAEHNFNSAANLAGMTMMFGGAAQQAGYAHQQYMNLGMADVGNMYGNMQTQNTMMAYIFGIGSVFDLIKGINNTMKSPEPKTNRSYRKDRSSSSSRSSDRSSSGRSGSASSSTGGSSSGGASQAGASVASQSVGQSSGAAQASANPGTSPAGGTESLGVSPNTPTTPEAVAVADVPNPEAQKPETQELPKEEVQQEQIDPNKFPDLDPAMSTICENVEAARKEKCESVKSKYIKIYTELKAAWDSGDAKKKQEAMNVYHQELAKIFQEALQVDPAVEKAICQKQIIPPPLKVDYPAPQCMVGGYVYSVNKGEMCSRRPLGQFKQDAKFPEDYSCAAQRKAFNESNQQKLMDFACVNENKPPFPIEAKCAAKQVACNPILFGLNIDLSKDDMSQCWGPDAQPNSNVEKCYKNAKFYCVADGQETMSACGKGKTGNYRVASHLIAMSPVLWSDFTAGFDKLCSDANLSRMMSDYKTTGSVVKGCKETKERLQKIVTNDAFKGYSHEGVNTLCDLQKYLNSVSRAPTKTSSVGARKVTPKKEKKPHRSLRLSPKGGEAEGNR